MPLKRGPHPRRQFSDLDGLANEVACPEVKRRDLFGLLIAVGNCND
jgi:hypothetical protein